MKKEMKGKAKATERLVATLTVHRVNDLSSKGAEDLYTWLFKVRDQLYFDPQEIGNRYTARYYVKERRKGK